MPPFLLVPTWTRDPSAIPEELRKDRGPGATVSTTGRRASSPISTFRVGVRGGASVARAVLRQITQKGRVMRYKLLVVLLAVGCIALSTGAQAQDRPVNVSLGGGFTIPNSDVRDHLGDGYNFNFGVQVNVSPVIGIEGLYSFNGLGDKRISIPVSGAPGGETVPTDFSASMNMQYGTASVIFKAPQGTVRPYGLVGMGVYYRPVKVTTPGVGYVPGYCDPWWYVCYPGGFVPVENIVGERSSTDFGMDFGGGVNFGAIYAEIRYHYIWGPEIQPQVNPLTGENVSGTGGKANGQFLQTTFGIRF
jgi:opacity protein-like surface antigen